MGAKLLTCPWLPHVSGRTWAELSYPCPHGMVLGQVGDTSFHHRNNRRTKQRTSVASVSLGTIYDVQWKLMMQYQLQACPRLKKTNRQTQGLDFPFEILFSCHQKPTEHSFARSTISSSSGPYVQFSQFPTSSAISKFILALELLSLLH